MIVFHFTLVRHGETLYNRKKITQGQTDIPLSNLGIKQANLVAKRLSDEKFTHVFSSDLSRAHKTAQIIMEKNSSSDCPIIKDKRLRERKYGECEGKPSKEFVSAAKKSNSSVMFFTPLGAETHQQLHDRAAAFFEDVCKQIQSWELKVEEVGYTPASVHRHGGSLGRISLGQTKLQSISGRRSYSFCGISSMDDASKDLLLKKCEMPNEKKRKLTDSVNEKGIERSQAAAMALLDTDNECKSAEMEENMPSATGPGDSIGRSDSSSSSGYLSLTEREDNSDKDFQDTLPTGSSDSLFRSCSESSLDFPDDGAKVLFTAGTPPVLHHAGNSCPNVSLHSKHRLSSMSSISSGRNSSFDDVEGFSQVTANILVVSHGGLIRKIIEYFVDELGCRVPGGRTHALKICSNCSLSKFTVSLHNGESPTVTCLSINDHDHIKDMDFVDIDL